MKVDAELVRHVAQLCRLSLTESEIDYYQCQLSSILDYVAQLKEMPDHLGNDWRHDLLGHATAERLDQVQESLPVELVFESAPDTSGSFFQVPRILE